MIIQKMLATFGEGSAEIDLRLNDHEFAPGDTVEGRFYIEGGKVEQAINGISVTLILNHFTEEDEEKRIELVTVPVESAMTIAPGEQKELPFSLKLPENMPISCENVHYYFSTRLDIAGGIDHLDTDWIEICPPKSLGQVFNALRAIGFAESEASGSIERDAQEFEFKPSSSFIGTIEEIEFVARLEEDAVILDLEVDLLSRRWKEIEIEHELRLKGELLANPKKLAEHLEEVLEDIVQHPKKYQRFGSRKHKGKGYFGMVEQLWEKREANA